jgi:hypothetical protein
VNITGNNKPRMIVVDSLRGMSPDFLNGRETALRYGRNLLPYTILSMSVLNVI